MASVRLGRYELEEYDLPRVCMRCGARADTFKRKKFQWSPPWAFLALGAFGAALFSKSVTMSVPLCEKHKWHWGGRMAFFAGGFFVLLALFGVGTPVVAKNDHLAGFVFLPILVLLLAWLITSAILFSTQIRPREITDKSVTLTGVSEEFVEALDEERRGDDEDRPRRRPRYDDEDEDDRPRRKRRADDGGYYDPGRRRRRPPSDAYEEGDDRP